MVRASTQQTVDRIVGTAAVIGLSVAVIRWLSYQSSSHMLEEKEYKDRRKKYSWMPWWWPVIAMESWNKRNRTTRRTGEECGKDENHEETIGNIDGDYEHQGSCHCGLITFLIRGPQRLQAVDSPGKIRYPHVPTSANRFQLLRGESDMRFYYEEDNDDSSSITFEHAGEERNDTNEALGAHAFCGNCGVHVFHADRTSGELEVNANCLDGGETTLIYKKQSSARLSSITMKQQGKLTPRSQSSLSSTLEFENAKNSTIETVSETEPFLGSARFLETMDDNSNTCTPRKESMSSDPTQSESYSTSIIAENDDLSMGSSSITGASMPLYYSSLSVASHHDRTDRAGLPPLPPSRISSSDRSVKTLPAFLGERPGYVSAGVRRGVDSSWSVASIESNDMDGGNAGKPTISPRMRDQMKKYMSRHMSDEK
ncbi:hypothetical protein ACHAXR_009251 [Thalassiosira sp. AJA248-18]